MHEIDIDPQFLRPLEGNLVAGDIILLWWLNNKRVNHECLPSYFKLQYGINAAQEMINLQIDHFKSRLSKLAAEAAEEAQLRKSLNLPINHPSPYDDPIGDSGEKLAQMTALTNQNIDALSDDIDQLTRVKAVYDRYNKSSYVRLNDITTISKYRLRHINKYDPSGKILLTGQQMSDISLLIQKLYLSEPKNVPDN